MGTQQNIGTGFATQGEALAYQRHIESQRNTHTNKDLRPLLDLCQQWYKRHGIQLKDGKRRLRKLEILCDNLDQPTVSQFTAAMFVDYRAQRLHEIAPATTNRELSYIKAVFNELKRCGEWHANNPLEFVRPIKVDEIELGYLTHTQITGLLDNLSKRKSHAYIISKICLATGARWSEASNLKRTNVLHGKVTFSHTKSGKTRAIPISPILEKEILAAMPLKDGLGAFRRAIDALNIELPKGQLTHVLRHTFASHFVMKGGSILILQKILGHSTVLVTMRYAHLAPDHLLEAVKLNPIHDILTNDTRPTTHEA